MSKVRSIVDRTSWYIDRPVKVSPTSINVGGKILTITDPVPGTDYYFNNSEITSTKNEYTLGGFHYGLTPSDEAPTGNKTEEDMIAIRGINAYSIWTNWFRPVANPEGMIHVNGRWYDIYLLNSEHIANGTSKAGLTIAAGTTDNGRAIPKIPIMFGGDGDIDYGKFTWFQAGEIAKAHSKDLIPYPEFQTIAYGVNEQKSAETDGYEVTVGKIEHYSNLTSKWGIEQATGTQFAWGMDVSGNRDEGSTDWAYRTGLTDNRGSIYSTHDRHITAVLLGGRRGNGDDAGSRISAWDSSISNSSYSIGARFSSDHLEVR